ncbi:hypothetical protein ACFL3T_02110 [Patescibacteria group bacterium]
MSDFEIFGGVDDSGGVDEASFEKFKERIKAAQAQIKAIQKGEQKVRKKEEKLIKILLRFVKNHQKKDIMLLIARLLEQNIPSIFILSIVLLGNEDVLNEDESKTLLKAPEKSKDIEEMSLATMDKDQLLPVKLKVRIDDWLKSILSSALDNPHKLLQTALDSDKHVILPLVQLCAFILRDYLEKHKEEANYEDLKDFSQFFLSGIMEKVADKVLKQKELKDIEDPEAKD